jgi:hypothetical protein
MDLTTSVKAFLGLLLVGIALCLGLLILGVDAFERGSSGKEDESAEVVFVTISIHDFFGHNSP